MILENISFVVDLLFPAGHAAAKCQIGETLGMDALLIFPRHKIHEELLRCVEQISHLP